MHSMPQAFCSETSDALHRRPSRAAAAKPAGSSESSCGGSLVQPAPAVHRRRFGSDADRCGQFRAVSS
eukprot:7721879-Alexandrium_andersonii.AAC.1